MNLALAPYLFLLFLSVTVCWFIAFYAWRRRQYNAAPFLSALLLAAGFWALLYGLELIAPTLSTKLFFLNLKQLGASVLGPAILFFTLQFTQQQVKHPFLLVGVLLFEPIATQIIFWTNPWHGWAGTPQLITNVFPFPIVYYEFGPWYWISVFIGYLLLTVSALILAVRLPEANALYRKQLVLLVLGLLLPWIVGGFGVLGLFNWQYLDATTFVFWLSGLLIALGHFRYQLLQVSPVAYSAVFSSIRDGIMVLDKNGRIIETNPATLKLLGLRERELLGHPISAILPIDQNDFLSAEQGKTRTAANLEFFYEKGGQNRYLEMHAAAIDSNIYIASGYVLILYDVTDRMLAEKAHQFSENRYRTIFENDSAATVLLENDMTISLANERFAALSGYSRREIEGKLLWTHFVHADDLPRMMHYHKARRKDNSTLPNAYEFRFYTKSRALRNVYVSVALVPDSTISVASLLDITQRKLAEQLLEQRASELETAVRSEQERSAIILQSISDAIALSDLDYKIIYVNPAFTQLTGFPAEELDGKVATFVINGRLPESIWQQLLNALFDQKVWEGEMQFKRKNGTVYDAAVLIAPVYDGNKKLIGYVSSHRDISKAKQLEASRRRFVTSISHELRTPVTNLKLYTDLLHRHFNSNRRDHYFEVLNEQIGRLERIIQNTLEITGLEDQRKERHREHIHWESFCDSLQVRLHPQAVEKNITLHFEPSLLQLPSFLGDPQRLGQAVYELVHNAIMFTPPGGYVAVSGGEKSVENHRWLLLSIIDHGPGIDAREQEQIFDRFFRGKQAAAGQIPGTGLGLSMVKLIVEAHNGRITIDSTPGQGSTFTIWLPLT